MTELEFLHGVDILSDLGADDLEILRQHLKVMPVAADDAICDQGDEGHELYIVREGGVAVRVTTADGGDIVVAEMGPGDFFGEMAIFEDAPRSASCVMIDDGVVLRLGKDNFFDLMAQYPDAAIRIMSRMVAITTGRLHATSAFLSDLVQWGESARRRAITDQLTGLYNRRFLDSALDEHVVESNVKNRVFSLIMMDLDHFHQINDTYGQQFGDAVIKAVAPCISNNLSENAVAARYGGDEFTIILPGVEASGAFEVAESIRSAVAELQLMEPGGAQVTVTTSQGVAEYPSQADSSTAIKEKADLALYKAKESGRNRAVRA